MNRITGQLLNAVFTFFSILPLPVLYFFSDLFFVVLFYGIHYRKKVVITNLKKAFPDKDDRQIKKIAKEFYRHFCDLIIETLKFKSIGKAEIQKRLQVKNAALLNQYFDQNRSIILYMGHYGNWEWLPALPLCIQHKMVTFYKPLSNQYFNQLIKSVRERFGMVAIESKNAYKALVNFAKNDIYTLTVIIGDQSPGHESSKHWMEFMNQETAFLIGADRIAKKTNQVLMFPMMKKLKRGYYEVEFIVIEEHPVEVSSNQMIEHYARELEAAINLDPSMWLWSHRRWKLSKEAIAS